MYVKFFPNSRFRLQKNLPITKHSKFVDRPCYLLVSRRPKIEPILEKLHFLAGIISTPEILKNISEELDKIGLNAGVCEGNDEEKSLCQNVKNDNAPKNNAPNFCEKHHCKNGHFSGFCDVTKYNLDNEFYEINDFKSEKNGSKNDDFEKKQPKNGHFSRDFELIPCEDPQDAWAFLSSQNFPLQPKNQIAITGTNGKTSSSFFAYQILLGFGENVILINSLGIFANGNKISEVENTTPDSYVIHQAADDFCRKFGQNSYLVVETSSIGIEQKRTKYLNFSTAVWTNFSQEHQDYHQTLQNYFREKLNLANLSKRFLIHNSVLFSAEKFFGSDFFQNELKKFENCQNSTENSSKSTKINEKIQIYGPELISVVQKDQLYIEYEILDQNKPLKYINPTVERGKENHHTPLHLSITSSLLGKFQANNLLSAIMAVNSFFSLEKIYAILQKSAILAPIGRMQRIGNVIIDNSHKPEALKVAIEEIRESGAEKIIVISGAGGERDRIKRPQIGQIMEENREIAIITSDNPRNENPLKIIDEILAGTSYKNLENYQKKCEILCKNDENYRKTMEKMQKNVNFEAKTSKIDLKTQNLAKILVIPDRKFAIETAIRLLGKNDICLLAGKGGENTIEIQGKSVRFVESEIVLEILQEKFGKEKPPFKPSI